MFGKKKLKRDIKIKETIISTKNLTILDLKKELAETRELLAKKERSLTMILRENADLTGNIKAMRESSKSEDCNDCDCEDEDYDYGCGDYDPGCDDCDDCRDDCDCGCHYDEPNTSSSTWYPRLYTGLRDLYNNDSTTFDPAPKEEVAVYVNDLAGGKVLKQEANKCIKIYKDGEVEEGLTKKKCDKNRTYKLIKE